MAEYLIQDTTLINIADAVRAKTGKTETILISDMASEIASIPSGGASGNLNFAIVGGTTQPVNPVENTIWINTNTEITSYVFIPSEPSEASEGMVWISTGISGSSSFNALEGNGIYIYPTSAFQYINGAWVGKAAKIFKNNTWVSWETYLFNNGDVAYLSGGWKTVGGSQGAYSTGTPKFSQTSTSISASTNDSIGFLRHNNPIDLTPYTKVHFAGKATDNSGYTGTSNCCPIIMPTNSTNANNALKKQSLSAFGSFSDLQVDVTNINQEAYICWWFYDWGSMSANGTVTLNKVWLTLTASNGGTHSGVAPSYTIYSDRIQISINFNNKGRHRKLAMSSFRLKMKVILCTVPFSQALM